jgi:CRP-like cAMP-binding protein
MIGDVLLRRLQLIGELDDQDRRALLDIRGERRSLRPGEDCLMEGDRPTESVVVLAGLLQRYKLVPQGGRQVHAFYLAGETPSLETIPMEVMDNNLAAVSASEIGAISHAELNRVMEARPRVRMLIWRETLIQGAMFREWLTRNSRLLAHEQLAHFFCEMMTRARAAGVARGDSCELPISQQDLAEALGLAPVHVNRTLQILQASDLLSFRGGVLTVPDLDRLAEAAQFDPTYLHLAGPSGVRRPQ